MRKRFLYIILLFLSFTAYAFGLEFSEVTENSRPKLPDDFYYRKDYRIQWWYLTGHLIDETGREFGYELTFFVVGVQKREYKSRFGVRNIYISHFALSDVKNRIFLSAESADAGVFGFAGAAEKGLEVWVGNNSIKGTQKKMQIRASDKDMGIDLDLLLSPAKPVVLHGDAGYSRKSEESPLIASLYFSNTNLNTQGTLSIGNRTFRVKGKSWFDREISSRGFEAGERGWDWFSIQLKDEREVMLYLIRKKDGSVDRYSSGTLVYKDGSSRHLSLPDFKVTVLSHYRSAKTGAQYPSRWQIAIPSENLSLTVTPLIEDQEFQGSAITGNNYWEGTCSVAGTAVGRAYVELVGY